MIPFLKDPDFVLYQGDVREIAPHLSAESVQTIVTSPPYYGLRDYGTGTWIGGEDCDHVAARKKTRYDYTLQSSPKQDAARVGTDAHAAMWLPVCPSCGAERVDSQIGQEASVNDFVGELADVFDALRHTLMPDGTLFVNLGDCYVDGVLQGVPWKFAFEMKARGWLLFNDVIWVKPNGMPESVKRRFTKLHEHIFCFANRPGWKFNQQFEAQNIDRYVRSIPVGPGSWDGHKGRDGHDRWPNPEGRNMRDWWAIPPASYPGSHFAVFPDEIPRRCIAAGTDLGETVFDPFMGSGTTARIARAMGRRAVGVELSEEHCRQIADNTRQLSLLADDEGGAA